ncbi:PadR family transcriptional regulator [Acrocarpospora corrugata]|uniref:PadR family transcriptional regulator n=1 Tax=Acrocarpospora corrugata TaxID=35763 RepID=A0A5M3W8U0_9ACTN|nr:PadR family transcriptional regulator [Acrocarpospora corrugata]GES04422.1 PadR family transcriptional regulator [Acrocarpospora corrugata]
MARGPDLVGLCVLGLLNLRPSHPYELHRFIVDTRKDFVTGLPRSLYHAVDRLVAAGFIVPAAVSRDGRRPERTVFTITPAGRTELATRVRALLEQPDPDARILHAALSLTGALPPAEAEAALAKRAASLESALASIHAQLEQASYLPRLVLLEADFDRTLKAAELAWVSDLLADLRSGALTWDLESTAALLERHHADDM